MRLAIDVMGSDQGPHAIIAGSARAVVEHPSLELILFGPRQRITAELFALAAASGCGSVTFSGA
ncbi:hypothetical protein HORIV_27190 [Vreelandella olivaria]|uniref:Phosphate acyltransferase n=1 Tax=Vreelandella olivaria TaxID=390919 RepID=A0ABN5WUL1_9GAMM|nr:hypothetical protein HORIV_27190 [Halomonas olivaria]